MLRVVFMGTPEFAVPSLVAAQKNFQVQAVYSQPDRPSGRGLKTSPTPVKREAERLGLPIFQPPRLSQEEELDRLKELNPDVIVVVAYGKILNQKILNLPRLGCVNVHSSLLPRWRGASPIQMAILSGDSHTGVTTMFLVEELDAGDILLQKETPISSNDTAQTVHDRLSALGADLLVETLHGLEKNEIKPSRQDSSKVTYAPKMTKEMQWLNPTEDAESLERRVRALYPWPGTSLGLESGKRIKIKKAKAHLGLKGSVGNIFEQSGMLLMGTSKGCLEIVSLQEEGKKEMNVSEFLNGLKGQGIDLPLIVHSMQGDQNEK